MSSCTTGNHVGLIMNGSTDNKGVPPTATALLTGVPLTEAVPLTAMLPMVAALRVIPFVCPWAAAPLTATLLVFSLLEEECEQKKEQE